MSVITSKQKIITGTGLVNQFSDPILIDLRRFHFGITIAVSFASGTVATYGVQVSFDPQEPRQQGIVAGPVYWNNHDILVPGLTAAAQSNLAFPATYVRLSATALSGTIVLSVVCAIGTS